MMKLIKPSGVIILTLFLISFSSALGITPARTTVDFSPNLKQSISLEVFNSGEGKDMIVSVSGELAGYVTISTRQFSFLEGEKSKKISYEFSLPSDLEPGLHGADIIVLEVPKESESEVVQATLAVKTQLRVHVPFPGKYAKSDIFISDYKDGKIKFVIPVVSAGTYDLASVRANVDIFNKLGEKIDSFNTETISVESGKKKDLVYEWEVKDATIGDYLAVANLIYDGEVKRLEKRFKIGDKILELQEIRADDFSLGQIAKFEMLVENKWNEPIEDVFVDTKIFDERKQILSHFKSSVETIKALSKRVFISYWDTAGFEEGSYKTEVAINYGEKSVKKDLEFEVEENELRVIGLGYVISSGGEGPSDSSNLVVVLVIVVVLLVLVNILWFFILRKRMKK